MAAQLLYWKSVCILAWCWWDGHTIESIFTAISVTQLIPSLSGFLWGKKTNKVHFFFLTSHEDLKSGGVLRTCCPHKTQPCSVLWRWPRCWDSLYGCEPDRAHILSPWCVWRWPQSIHGRNQWVYTHHHTYTVQQRWRENTFYCK